jgi:outer membrane biosynthesis protein TonB
MSVTSSVNQFDVEPSRFRYEPQSMQEAMLFAEAVVQSGLVPHIKRKEAAFAVIVTGAELGLTAMQALRSIHVVDGKPTLSAELILGLVKRSSACQWFRLVESTNDQAVYETLRRGEPEPTRYVYSTDDANRAGLLSRRPWRQYTAAMLRARCATALARAVYPDLVAGIYDPDELQHHDSEPLPNSIGHGLSAGHDDVVHPALPSAPAEVEAYASPRVERASASAPEEMAEQEMAEQEMADEPAMDDRADELAMADHSEVMASAPAPAPEAVHAPEPVPAPKPAKAEPKPVKAEPKPAPAPEPKAQPMVDVTARMRELVDMLRAQGAIGSAAKFAGGRIAAHRPDAFATEQDAISALRDTFKKQGTSGDQYESLARAWLLLDPNAP